MKRILLLIGIFLICLLSCTKQVTKQTVTPEDRKLPVYHYTQGDTTKYVISFSSKKELRSFLRKFNDLIKNHIVDTVISDTLNQYFSLRIIPAPKDTTRIPQHKMSKIDKIDIIESDIEISKDMPSEDTIIPKRGGKVTLYTDRKFIDNSFSELLSVVPFSVDPAGNIIPGIDTSSHQFLSVNRISPIKIKITCMNTLKNYAGKRLTAFDIVKSWTELVKNRPAEGLALFTEVKGMREFIRGEEGIIQGFSASNENTIIITLKKPDPDAMQRLNSPNLLPPSLKIGKFIVKAQQSNKISLQQNPHYPFDKPFLDECTIICGKDKNPMISYSLNTYDIIILYKKKDLDYARKSMLINSDLIPFTTDRYFLSIANESKDIRNYLVKIIAPTEIHSNAVKAEGDVINQIESIEPLIIINKDKTTENNIKIESPLVFLYNTFDPVSVTSAEKLFSDLSHSNIPCKLKGLSKTKYESALVDRNYDIAIGWVPNNITANSKERLRLATIWFSNKTDEAKRISGNYEIPLFTIKRFALCKKNIKLYKNRLVGIYREDK